MFVGRVNNLTAAESRFVYTFTNMNALYFRKETALQENEDQIEVCPLTDWNEKAHTKYQTKESIWKATIQKW